jgi:hypothetical protein
MIYIVKIGYYVNKYLKMQIDNTYAVSTHKPVIEMILKHYRPMFVLELGIGLHSTPLFNNHKCRCIHVESNEEWIKKLNVDAILHPVTDEFTGINIPVTKLNEAKMFYSELMENIKSEILYPSLLFVDNDIAYRNVAINTLYPLFDLIIYHDCDGEFNRLINYKFNQQIKSFFDSYVLKNDSRWTGLLVNKNYGSSIDELSYFLEPRVEDYCKENKIKNNWKLECE